MKQKNNKDITYNELCNLISNEITSKPTMESVHKYLNAIYKVILKQLQLNNRIYFQNFGYFEVRQRKSGERIINNPNNNKQQIVYVKPRLSITFKPSSVFDYSVNENNFQLAKEHTVQKAKSKKRKNKRKKVDNVAELLSVANSRKGVND